MKKILLVVSLMLAYVAGVYSQNAPTGIRFEEGSYEQALEKARQENKLLFVDVWATWCGPCKKLAKDVFTQSSVGDFFNDAFVNYKVQSDIEDPEIQKKYKDLMLKYNVGSLPTLLWLNGEGKMVHSKTGYMDAQTLLAEAATALNPEKRAEKLIEEWDSMPKTLANGLVYFGANPAKTDKFDDFFLSLSPEEQLDDELMAMLYFRVTLPPDSRALHYMASKKDSLAEAYPKAQEWTSLVENNVRRIFSATPIDSLDGVADRFASYNLPNLMKYKDTYKGMMYMRYGKIEEGFEIARKVQAEYKDNNMRDFVDVAFFMASKDHVRFTDSQAKEVVEWAKCSVDPNSRPDSYVNDLILYEAYALVGDKKNMKKHMDNLLAIASKKEDPKMRQKQIDFYNSIAEQAANISH